MCSVSRRRAPDSEPRSRHRAVGKGSEPASSNASLSHPSLLYRCTVSAAEEGRWLGERRVHKLCESLLAISKAPAAAGRRRAPSACLRREGPPRPRPGPAAPSGLPSGLPQTQSGDPQPGAGRTGPSELARSPPERGRRVREAHCSPIRQLTGKRMERPPPPWLPKPLEMGKVTGTEMPFSPLRPQSQRRLQ